MGETPIWMRILQWLRHPISNAAATIAFRYVESQPDLEIHWSAEARRRLNPCTCGPNEGCNSCPRDERPSITNPERAAQR